MNAPQVDNSILFPVARIVQGDLYEPQDTDMQGNKLVTKSGPNAGQPRVNYFFSIAIPKNPGETVFWQSPWGAKIYNLARAAWPTLFDASTGQCLHRNFAWKISDGDDTTPNPDAQMKRNCDREGYPGHWIVRLGSGWATKIFDESGQPLLAPGLVKRGFWVEVLAVVNSNENTQKPGLYINHSMVAYRAPGKEIISGPDPRSVGFGKAALPAGVTAQPISNVANIPAAPAAPGVPTAPAMVAPPVAATPVAAPTPVQPHPGFIAPPVAGGSAPAVPPAPAVPAAPVVPSVPTVPTVVCPLGAPTGHKMTNLNGPRYEAMKAAGWTDPLLIQNGYMVRL